MFLLPMIRGFLYIVLWLFSAVLLGLTATRIHYTTHLPPGDPLNQGRHFYDPIVAELMACAILALLWAPLVAHMIHGRREYRYLSKVWHELLGLFVLWVLWLVGAAIATHIWPNLPAFCSQFQACRVLTAMLAFAWMGWIMLCLLMLTTLLYAVTNSSWHEPAHGHWVRNNNPRASEYGSSYVVRA
ncbi:uncharacterized protein FOMMEDRAFT_143374 [Fomitiporia mediterranea MF3/22]|uniref:uncharacterized protein n=1 Tax=Fomitiporia mediterranea (strain MF3/22) TaxID=694068 RepID=UPI000440859D|nr:uncharacterized protein FOMMEDRAFT_143374 [Fomitiporia mediterranea MF3/22]EJC97817.1 hypothetical protein FOMMEDRAFT_143374 [Fomitiporia mediterranea MF3/22]